MPLPYWALIALSVACRGVTGPPISPTSSPKPLVALADAGVADPPPVPDPTTTLYSPQQLATDLHALRESFEEAHASLYRYHDKRTIDAAFEAATSQIDHSLGEIEFYGVVTSVLAQIGDGHTVAYLSGPVRTHLAKEASVFPLHLRFVTGHAYVVGTTVDGLDRGCELTSIDGVPVVTIATKILAHLAGDGLIEAGKYRALARNFGLYYYLYVGRPSRFRVGCVQNHDTVTVDVPALTESAATQERTRRGEAATPDAPPLKLDWLDDGKVARLVISTFADDSFQSGGFATLLTSAFEQISTRKAADLIIDLRDNDGGDALGPILYSFLAAKKFRWVDRVEAATRDLAQTKQYTSLKSEFLTRFAASVVARDGRFFVKPDAEPLLGTQSPQRTTFRGRVWILTNGDTFSATAMFCDIARSERRATFVGEETGGAYGGNSAGEFVVITLPETKLKAVVPLEEYVMSVTGRGDRARGVIPDIEVHPTAADLVASTDVDLTATLAAIAKQRH